MAAAERREQAPGQMTADEFCAAYYDRVVGLAVHAFGGDEAYDVAHEALSRVLASYATLDPERDAWPWLSAIVRNAGRERLRRRRFAPLDEADAVSAPDEAFDALAAQEERRTLARALERLPRGDRDVLLMRVRDELPFAEIARRTGRTPGALRVQAVRARQRLAEEFARLGGTAYGVAVLLPARLRSRFAGAPAAWPVAQLAAAVLVVGGVVGGPAGTTAGAQGPPRAPAPFAAPATAGAPATRGAVKPLATPSDEVREPAAATAGTATREAPRRESGGGGKSIRVATPVAAAGADHSDSRRRPPARCAVAPVTCQPPGTQIHVSTRTWGSTHASVSWHQTS